MNMEIIVNNIKYDLRPEDGGAFVIANDYRGDIVIPAQFLVNGAPIPVVGIAEDAFYACDDVTSVILSDGLTIIENSAFESMNGLKEIVIPDSVTHIGKCAFSDCEKLQRVVLPSQLQVIAEDLFESCGSLTEVNIPAGVRVLQSACFAACVNLKTIVLPEGLQTIEDRVFEFCESLENINLPSTLKHINSFAFYSCLNLKQIVLPEGLEYVPEDCFAMCQRLEDVVIPSSVKMVEKGAFSLTPYKKKGVQYVHDLLVGVGHVDTEDGCLNIKEGTKIVCDEAVSDYDNTLRKVICPSSLRQIGRSAFANSKNLCEVVLNEGLEYIDAGAFMDCKNLRYVYIPSTVKRIEAAPFSGCDQLEKIVVSPDNPYYDSRGECNAIIDTAKNMLVSGCHTTQIPDDVVEIGCIAFASTEKLEEITIPDSVKKIEWNAFNNCKNLQHVRFPKHLEYIGEGAFAYCEKLEELDLPASVKTIEFEAFNNTPWLRKKPDGMVIVGSVLYKYKPFDGDEKVEPDCIIPEGVESISDDAFYMLEKPLRIYLPKSLKTYNAGSLRCLTKYYTMIRPEGVGEDYPYTDKSYVCATVDDIVYELDNWQKTARVVRPYDRLYRGHIIIPESISYEGETYRVDTIGRRAFAFDDAYTYEMFEEKELGRYIDGKFLLESPCYVEIPATVNQIESEAFMRCFDLCCVVIHGSMTVGKDVFKDCDSLQTILVSSCYKSWYRKQIEDKYDCITDCVAKIDGVYYHLNEATQKARVIKHYQTNEEYNSVYKGYITIPAAVEHQGITFRVTDIAAYAFYDSTIDGINLPEGLETIGNNAFMYCENLRTLEIPDTVTTVGEAAFTDCENLRYVKLSENQRLMRNELFSGCSQLQTVLLGSEIKNVSNYAFSDCKNLRSIYLPETVKKIGEGAFHGCSSLKELRIPDSVHILDMNVFEDCYEMNNLILGPNISHVKGIDEVLSDWEATIFVPRHKIDDYCQKGLEPLREHIQALETMEAESMEALLDWFIEHQLGNME